MYFLWSARFVGRVRLFIASVYRRYSNLGPHPLRGRFATYCRRTCRPKNHVMFALSYAAIKTTTEEAELDTARPAQCYNPLPDKIEELKWEKLVQDDTVCVYRRWISSINTYEYRCAGSYKDISAENFVKAQMDVEYRKKWDSNVLQLETLEKRSDGSEVLRWLHKFPRPMSARIYIYLRRVIFDEETQSMQVNSEALDEKDWPTNVADKNYVRVTTYRSQLNLFAHSEFTENGFDYVLTYYDYPKAAIPGPAYNWMVNYGGQYFLKDIHDAAKRLSTPNTSTE